MTRVSKRQEMRSLLHRATYYVTNQPQRYSLIAERYTRLASVELLLTHKIWTIVHFEFREIRQVRELHFSKFRQHC